MQPGEKLFELRKKYGYSQEELAEKLNVTKQNDVDVARQAEKMNENQAEKNDNCHFGRYNSFGYQFKEFEILNFARGFIKFFTNFG